MENKKEKVISPDSLTMGEGWGGAFGLLFHYIKVAFRNLWRYKTQSLISILGLAVGFTCFALATLWVRYEMTFDSFHKDAKQMYVVYKQNFFSSNSYSRSTNYPLASYLKETFPEVSDAMTVIPYRGIKVKVEDVEYTVLYVRADSSFLQLFDVKILEGSREFLIPGNTNIAVTRGISKQLFGDEYPIGKTVSISNQELTVCAIVSDMPQRSNYAFDIIRSFQSYVSDPNLNMWRVSLGENTVIRLEAGTNIESFEKKLYEHETGQEKGNISKLQLKPLTKMRYLDENVMRDVKFQHIVIFALSGLLVILCSLFNGLTLFISRFRIRQKELALRVVCGASGGSLFAMLTVEFTLTLCLAVALGGIMTHGLYEPFQQLSNITMDFLAVYREMLMYIGGVLLISLLAFWLILAVFRFRNLNLSIRRSNKKLFRKISVIVQLIISIGFAFCSIVIFMQMYFLHHSGELGFSFRNRGAIRINDEGYNGVLINLMKQIPEISKTVDAQRLISILPQSGRSSHTVDSWDDKPADTERITIELVRVSPEYVAFYDFRLLAGEMLTEADPDSLILLNESAVKAFGWYEPVGKSFDGFTVKGVIKNVYNFAPTVQVSPILYLQNYGENTQARAFGSPLVLFEYQEGMWKSIKEKIEQMIKNEHADLKFELFNYEEEYDKFLKSENALIKLLSFVSAICVLICVFGFVSLVSLTCEERRKSIAIRKINGATVRDILAMFAKEYTLLLLAGAVIAFPAGFLIMQRWLEQYVKQTDIPAWIYLSILCMMALVIVLCVGWQVYKTSVENPAEVVKSE